MSSWARGAFWYGLGASVGRALFGEASRDNRAAPRPPIRPQTEAEILADEARYDEEARQLEAGNDPASAAPSSSLPPAQKP